MFDSPFLNTLLILFIFYLLLFFSTRILQKIIFVIFILLFIVYFVGDRKVKQNLDNFAIKLNINSSTLKNLNKNNLQEKLDLIKEKVEDNIQTLKDNINKDMKE